jgi:hypothetical protein
MTNKFQILFFMKKKLLFLFLLPLANLQAQTVCNPATGNANLDINNVSAKVLGGGDMWWDQTLQSPQYEVPKGSGHHTMFAGSLWLGGLDVNNAIHLAAQTYRQTGNDFWPGPLDNAGTTNAANCQLYDRVWKINKSEIIAHIANPSNPPLSISSWPAKGNDIGAGNIITQDMAPFVDVNGNGTYEPTAGDYPKINGDQAIWYVFNDIGNVHSETGASPLGVEIQVMAYAFMSNDVLNNTTFYNYTIKNKSTITYNDFYIGFWTDCDLGGYIDDFIGCDSSRNAAIFYNADDNDTQYGTNIPITAVVGLNNPLENNISVPMKYIGHFFNDASIYGNPVTAAHFYNYLSGKWKDGSSWGFNYSYPGSPCDSTQNSMVHPTLQSPADLRTIQSFGPMTFAPGGCKNITTAVVTTFNSTYPNPCFDNIKTSIDSVKALHQSLAINDLSCQTTSSLSESDYNNPFSVYPNPATEVVSIVFSKNIKGTFSVFAIDGSEVLNGNISGTNTQIELAGIKKGLYFIGIHDSKGQVIAVNKLVKE